MNARSHWWHGILARSLMAVVGIALLMGSASSVLVNKMVGVRTHAEVEVGLGELLDTVESTASVAAFVGDDQLAREVAHGLLRNREVLRVTILGYEHSREQRNVRELARAERASAIPETDAARVLPEKAASQFVIRQLRSPFTPEEIIGEIRLDTDQAAIKARVAAAVGFFSLALAGQLALVIAAAAAAMLFLVVRPIKATSDLLHRIDVTGGDRLTVPKSHAHSEIGRLVDDINQLANHLVETIDLERDLRRQQAIDQRKYQDLFDNAASGICVADRVGRLESFNPAFAELTWLPRSKETAGRWLSEANWREPERLLALLRNSLDATLATGRGALGDDFLLVGRRGDKKWLHVAATPLGDGKVQAIVTNVTQRRLEEIAARQLAVTDALTGFINRSGLQNSLAGITIETEPFALVMVDLDGFRRINDAIGFPTGDQLLLIVAERIRKLLNEGDRVARVGGDEFVLVLSGEHVAADVSARVNQLLQLIGQPYDLVAAGKHETIEISASAGIAIFPADGVDSLGLLRSAELALNSAKTAGGGIYRHFDPALQAAVEHRRRIEDDLRHALSAGELHLVYQPIIDLYNGRLIGAEALLRWLHPVRGSVSPDVFIPLAEDIGLIGDIGLMVLDKACHQAAAWRREGLDLYVSVNVSVKQIPDGLPPATVIDLLKCHELPNTAIALEITEGVLMNNVGVAQNWIESLRTEGLRVYLDDFGTGYSSLSYLKRFPLDTVKVDKSFIHDMAEDNSDRALVEAIVTMARSLGLRVVAEGIENQTQLDILRSMGCGYGQGYFFSRPVKSDEFAQVAARISAEQPINWSSRSN
jgi:diguanylate cyclase (GGDEF)-like protein